MKIGAILCVALASSSIAATAEEEVLFSSSATESIVITRDKATGGANTRHVSVDYHQLFWRMPQKRDMIARETIITSTADNLEGTTGTAVVELFYKKAGDKYASKPDHVTTVSAASDVTFENDHWTATITGCCDSEPMVQLFAYGKDKPFLYSNSQYAHVYLPNADVSNYVGVVLRSQTASPELRQIIFGDNEKAVAAVLYASPEKPLQKLLLEPAEGVTGEDIPYHTMPLALQSSSAKDEDDGYNKNPKISQVLTMWSQDPVANKGKKTDSVLSIIATLVSVDDTKTIITIPVENGKFQKPTISGNKLVPAAKK